MGLPVNGVDDVEKWALDVGLVEEMEEENIPGKRRKLNDTYTQAKYGESSTVNVMDEMGNFSSPERDEREDEADDMDVDQVIDLKGKKKMDNQ